MIIPNSNESSCLGHALRCKFGRLVHTASEIITGGSRALPSAALPHGGRQVIKSLNYHAAHLEIPVGYSNSFCCLRLLLAFELV